MIIHCDSCGKAVSNRLEKCPFCRFSVQTRKEEYSSRTHVFEEFVPTFQRKIIV